MSNIIGLNTKLFGLEKNIKQSEPTRVTNDLGQLGDPAGKERVLNPIVSEFYMQKYIEEHGGGGDMPVCTVTIINTGNTSTLGIYSLEDNVLTQIGTFEANETVVAKCVYIYDDLAHIDTLYSFIDGLSYAQEAPVYSDAVNVTFDESYHPIITDTSLPSSFTATVKMGSII